MDSTENKKGGKRRMFENVKARIHSKGGELDDVVVIEESGNNNVRVSYKGSVYTAIFNPFAGTYYVDDLYGYVGPDTAGHTVADAAEGDPK